MQLKAFLKGLDNVSEWSGRIFIWLIVPLTGVVVFEVISRRVFGAPHIWATEVTNYLYGPHFMLQRFSPRTRGILDCFTHLVFFFPFLIILLTQGILYAYTSWSIHETSESAALTILPLVKTVIPVTALLLLIQGLSHFIRSIMQAVRGAEG
jgi:TRAP-type mannitol/chloroaromatic compound transport system permease small subunit